MPYVFNPFTNNLDATTSVIIPPGTVATLSGNSGGPVPPAGGNIDIIGSGEIVVIGDALTSTLEISTALTQGIVTLTGDTGGAISGDISDNVNIIGDGTTISISGDSGTSTLTVSAIPQAPPLTWNIITTDQTAVAGNAYFVNVAVGTVSISLPASGVLGDTIVVSKVSVPGTVQILVGAGQAVTFGNVQSFGPTGSVATTELGASITLVYFETNSWYVYTAIGNFIIS